MSQPPPQLTAEVWQSVERFAAAQSPAVDMSPSDERQVGAATGETIRLAGIDCPQCGVSNPATANFCMRCGSSLREMRAVSQE